MVDEVAGLLREPSPLGLLHHASGLIEVTEPTTGDRVRGAGMPLSTGDLFDSFVESGFPELALLAHAGQVLRPGLVSARLDIPTLQRAPAWMACLGDAHPTAAALHQHLLDDGENVLVSWEWPDGNAATIVVYVDHNLGTLVKDAFVVDEDLAALQATYDDALEPGMTVATVGLADARARIEEALENHDQLLDAPESDTWPVVRPLLQWVVRLLPTGGTGYERPEWSEADRQRLLDDFAASPFAEIPGLRTDEVASLAEPLIWFGCDHGPGDPLRWSPVAVEIVLTDWYPRKVLGLTDDDREAVADVLAGFIRYAHRERRVPRRFTTETLEAVAYWRDDPFDDWADGSSGPVLDLDDPASMEFLVENLERNLIDLVGGPANYANLNDEPLPDVAFDWTAVPHHLHDLTGRTLESLDRWAEELFDLEVRTIARAVLAAVVTTDTATFTRSQDTDGLAAAILGHQLRRLTDRLSPGERRQLPWRVGTLKALAAETGVGYSKVTGRRKTVENVLDRSDLDWSAFLHSSQRRDLLATKSQIAEWRTADRATPDR